MSTIFWVHLVHAKKNGLGWRDLFGVSKVIVWIYLYRIVVEVGRIVKDMYWHKMLCCPQAIDWRRLHLFFWEWTQVVCRLKSMVIMKAIYFQWCTRFSGSAITSVAEKFYWAKYIHQKGCINIFGFSYP
jgi:hypothetical protein